MKLYVETFGCQMNVADSQEMSRYFLDHGVELAKELKDADVVLLNTCTVRQQAEQRALSYIGRLKEWKKQDADRCVIVAGCAAERLQKEMLSRFPQVDLVVGAKSITEFPAIINQHFKKRRAQGKNTYNWFQESQDFDAKSTRAIGAEFVLGNKEDTAFVTIMRGCNYSCTYCIVPSVRGRESYRDPAEIVSEIQQKSAAGQRKVMLLGQTVNSFWHKNEEGKITDFADLLRQVQNVQDVQEIRFMSPHPHYMSDKTIAALAECNKVSNEIHMPVQSGSDRMLQTMKRNYTNAEFIAIAQKLRAAIPNLALSTDFIVGFPGETEEDFAATVELTKKVQFSIAYCFKYSPRAGTVSAQTMPDDIAQEVKEDRLQRLLACF